MIWHVPRLEVLLAEVTPLPLEITRSNAGAEGRGVRGDIGRPSAFVLLCIVLLFIVLLCMVLPCKDAVEVTEGREGRERACIHAIGTWYCCIVTCVEVCG